MLSTKLKEAAGNSADATLYVDDVFSIYLTTGAGANITVNNGIDLAGKGGLVWNKTRNSVGYNTLFDTVRGVNNGLFSNTSDAQSTTANWLPNFNSDGFVIGTSNNLTTSGTTGVSYTFRKAAKFFDVVTYTGTGTTAQNINHNLGSVPGMIIVKRTDSSSDWGVVHRSTNAYALYGFIGGKLNTTGVVGQTIAEDTGIYYENSTYFTVDEGSAYFNPNASGGTYVAYLFAHDTSSTGIIQCGSFTASGSGAYSGSATVNLGWEPQYVLMKEASNTLGRVDWTIVDMMRGWPAPDTNNTFGYANVLSANKADAAVNAGDCGWPTATGFSVGQVTGGATYIYMAIRRPNKPPTSGTQVFAPVAYSGNDTARNLPTGFVADAALVMPRNAAGNTFYFSDRLRGASQVLQTQSTAAEISAGGYMALDVNNGVNLLSSTYNASPYTFELECFKRAPGFFDVVCYTGDGTTNRAVAHNLGVAPELVIIKNRTGNGSGAPDGFGNAWWVQTKFTTTEFLASRLQTTNAGFTENYSTSLLLTAAPTSTGITLGNYGGVNATAFNYVAYLFATLAGISKVGSYTGNGTGQAIACGFSAGARFVLIKRTDSTGDWYTFDSARGLTSGSSPYLLLNSTAAEVTGNNGVYASTGGFTLGATAITTTNILGASYIYLSVA